MKYGKSDSQGRTANGQFGLASSARGAPHTPASKGKNSGTRTIVDSASDPMRGASTMGAKAKHSMGKDYSCSPEDPISAKNARKSYS